ncbi:MAG: hypothetical protein CL840_19710 [Crocinitomicaceae bacterium]|mgnify:CR=1 FL=1|nr:hypothetical protein [Crocinitomicaceae bacterium]|tara:strand:+ start:10268 stop:12781 length:2514 start_codon:yes stop_codon:yes gene_type:complete
MLRDFAKTSPVTFFSLPIIIIGLLILSYFLYSTLLTQQIEARSKYLDRQVEISIDKIDQLIREFNNEIPFIAEIDDFGQVFDLESENAKKLRYRIQNLSKRYGEFVDTLFIYDESQIYFVDVDEHENAEEGYLPLANSSYPLQFSTSPKIVHLKGNKSLAIIPTSSPEDTNKVYLAALINVFNLIKSESKHQFIGDHGYKVVFSENMGFRIAHQGEQVDSDFGLIRKHRQRIVNDLLEHQKGELIHSGSNRANVFLTIYHPIEIFSERYGLIFSVSDKDFIEPVRSKLQIIFISFFAIITLVIVVFVINLRDISRNTDELEKSREGLARALTILEEQQETSRDGLIVADEDFRIISFNKRFANMVEFDEKLIKGADSRLYLDSVCKMLEDPAMANELKGLIRMNSVTEVQEEIHLNSGKIYDFYSSAIVDETGHNFGRIWAFRDITDRKNEIAELKRAKERALEGAKEKENFLSTMSHEIRTPLNSIVGFANLLLEENPREEQKEQLLPLKYSADSLLSLINDILDLTKIESGGIQFEKIPFRLNEKLQRAHEVFAQSAKDKGITINLKVDDTISSHFLGDYNRLNQIIYNILSNAVKFTSKGSVEIGSKLENSDGNKETVLIWFKDTGIGIEASKQELIFKNFSQADSKTTREYGGTGLGLAITRMLVELQGGKIWLESEKGKGSTFYIRLTFETTEKPIEVLNENADLANLDGLKILLVEDNPINQKVAHKFLTRWGADVVVVDSGEDSLNIVREKNVDAVLMDLQMPEMDGYETSRTIRSMDGSYFKSLKIIAMSADALGDVKEKVNQAGMDGYISKPFDPNQLLSILANVKKG